MRIYKKTNTTELSYEIKISFDKRLTWSTCGKDKKKCNVPISRCVTLWHFLNKILNIVCRIQTIIYMVPIPLNQTFFTNIGEIISVKASHLAVKFFITLLKNVKNKMEFISPVWPYGEKKCNVQYFHYFCGFWTIFILKRKSIALLAFKSELITNSKNVRCSSKT